MADNLCTTSQFYNQEFETWRQQGDSTQNPHFGVDKCNGTPIGGIWLLRQYGEGLPIKQCVRTSKLSYFAVTSECVIACTERAMRFCTPTLRINFATCALTV